MDAQSCGHALRKTVAAVVESSFLLLFGYIYLTEFKNTCIIYYTEKTLSKQTHTHTK